MVLVYGLERRGSAHQTRERPLIHGKAMRRVFRVPLATVALLWGLSFHCSLWAQDSVLRIYGPEGPFAPMRECAALFYRVQGAKAEVLTGPGSTWIAGAKEEADIIYEETENRLSQFMMRHS